MTNNIGVDIVYIPEIKKYLNKKSFINKVYTAKEIEIANTYREPYNFYATRFASKEAIIKATNGNFDFKEIEILKDNNGKPLAKIINHNNYIINISISFVKDYAIAFCIIDQKK